MVRSSSKPLKTTATIVVLLAFMLYFALPMGFGYFASTRRHVDVSAPPQGFKESSIKSQGVKLAMWYAPSQNGAAIILLHGGTSSRNALRPYAKLLRDHGYGVLALDLRGHGESGGRGNGFGWEAPLDVTAAVSYLRRQGVKSIGGLGLSLGGETLLAAASGNRALQAVVAEGATHRCAGDYLALESNRSIARSWTTRVMYWSVRVFTGQRPPTPTIVQSLKSTKDASFLLIAAGTKPEEIRYNRMYAAVRPEATQLWIVPGAAHTGAYRTKKREYEVKVIDFFNKRLL